MNRIPPHLAALTTLALAALAPLAPSTAQAADLETCGSCGGGFGQQVLAGVDDASTAAIEMTALPHGINFFGLLHAAVFVNSNGNVTFGRGVTSFTPTPFPIANSPMIAPVWGDVDLGGAGAIFFANDTDARRLIVTWQGVGYFARKTNKINSFQVIIADRSDVGAPGDVDVELRYQRLEWTTGDASGGSDGLGGTPAQAGFDAGDRVNHVTLIGSRTAAVLDLVQRSNVDEPGVWRFPIRGGVVPACGNGTLEDGEGCDDGGNDDFDGCNATCQPEAPTNRPPTVDAGGPYLVSEGEALTLRADAEDPDSDPLSFAWDLGGGLFEDGFRPTLSFVVGDGPDAFEVRVQVNDGAETAEASAQVLIANLPPTIESLTCTTDHDLEGLDCAGVDLEGLYFEELGLEGRDDPDLEGLDLEGLDLEGLALESAPLIFRAAASDPGGDDITLTWDFGDGSPAATGSEVAHTFTDGGTYVVALTATDDDGAETIARQIILVAEAPPGQAALSGPERLEEGQEGRWTLHISKARFDTVTWTIDPGDGSKIINGRSTKVGEADTASFEHAFSRPGRYEIQVAVLDDDGQTSRVARTIEVTNRVPEITAAVIPTVGVEGAEIAFSASATDVGGALEFAWDFGDGGQLGRGAEASHVFAQDGRFEVSLSVSDIHGGVAERRSSILIRNAAPVILAFELAEAAVEGQQVQAQIEAADPGHDPLTFVWDFGEGDGAVRSAQPRAAHAWRDEGRYEVVVAVEDAQGGRSVRRQTVRVVNVAPTIISAPPTEAFARRLYTYRVEASDPGEDTLQIEIVEAPEGMRLEGDTLLWTPEAAARLPVSVSIRVDDGDGGIARQSWALRPVEVDLDGDGVADDCEARFGLDTSVDDADEDLDHDGLTNRQECLRGTDPKQFNGPSAPSPRSPGIGEEVRDRSPTLVVDNAVDPDGDRLTYTFEVYADEGLETLIAASGPVPAGRVTTSWVVDQVLKENETCWWRARAADAHTAGAFGATSRFALNATNEAPGSPVLRAPLGQIAQTDPEFRVEVSPDPEGGEVEVTIEVYEDEALTRFVSQGRTRGAALRFEGVLRAGGAYWWRAAAQDTQGARSPWSPTASFEISAQNRRPFAPTITQPGSGSVVGEVVQVVWHQAQDLEGDRLTYAIELATDATFQAIVLEEAGIEATSGGVIVRQLEGLVPGATYALRIVASDAQGEGLAAEVSFTTSAEALPTARVSPLDNGPVELVEGGALAFSIEGGAPQGCGEVLHTLSIFEDVSMERHLMAMRAPGAQGATTMVWEAPGAGEFAWALTTRCRIGEVLLENTSAIKGFEIKFVEGNASPSAPLLRSPAPEVELEGGSMQEFRITNGVDPEGDKVSYRFEIFADEAMTERLAVEEVAEGEDGETAVVMPVGGRAARTIWVVTAIDARGASARSAPQGYYIKGAPRGCSTLPAGGPSGELWPLVLLGLALTVRRSRRS